MEFMKVRNFIIACEDNLVFGKWDISTGEFYGKKDTVVKTVPAVFAITNLDDTGNDIYSWAIWFYRYNIKRINNYYSQERAQRLEALISVGLRPDTFCDLDSNTKLTKDLVSYLKDNYHGRYSNNIVKEYIIEKENTWLHEVNRIYRDAFTYYNNVNDIPFNFIKKAILIMNREYVHEIISNEYKIYDYIRHYYMWYTNMYNEEPKLENNFLKNYCTLKHIYNEWIKGHYEEALKKNNDKPFLYFENDTYCVFPLLTKDDFHKEATSQCNCVERFYMDKVKDNETYIVVVRHKKDKDKSYITCEVSHNGQIKQYLTRYNNYPRADIAIKFKELYQQHLNESINRA